VKILLSFLNVGYLQKKPTQGKGEIIFLIKEGEE
jgi:hypothetical protein